MKQTFDTKCITKTAYIDKEQKNWEGNTERIFKIEVAKHNNGQNMKNKETTIPYRKTRKNRNRWSTFSLSFSICYKEEQRIERKKYYMLKEIFWK